MTDRSLVRLLLDAATKRGTTYRKRRLTLVLSSDREIGRPTFSQERRVGITPPQVAELKDGLRIIGLELDVLVVQGAGQRAGFPDEDYVRAGAEIVTVDELQYHDAPPDVVHALKEPSSFERRIPRQFFRIGALHTGDFHEEAGLAGLLAPARDVVNRSESDFVTVFDGSNIGASESFRIPIRGAMSKLAGDIAGAWVQEHLDSENLKGRVVVVGGGNAGRAAAGRLLACPRVEEVHVFDSSAREDRLAELTLELGHQPRVSVFGIDGLDHPLLVESLRGSVSCILAVAKAGIQAPKVVRARTLEAVTRAQSLIVDISIDERGAIDDPEVSPSMSSEQIIPLLEGRFGRSGRRYRALPNMPRAYPGSASEAHGQVILPYIAALLLLSAEHGGVQAATQYLASQARRADAPDPSQLGDDEVYHALVQDLRNGMAFYPRDGRLVVESIIGDPSGIHGFLYHRKIPFEFTVSGRGSAEPEFHDLARVRERYWALPTDIRSSFDRLASEGVPFTVVYHPEVDGTRTENAASALRVPPEQVLKCLIFKAAGTEVFVAAVCSGTRKISEEKLARHLGLGAVRLASAADAQRVTGGHAVGGIPVFELLGSSRSPALPVYVDADVLENQIVYVSAGSPYCGIRLEPRYFGNMGVTVADITEPSVLTTEERERLVREARRLAKSLEREDLQEAETRLRRIRDAMESVGVASEVRAV